MKLTINSFSTQWHQTVALIIPFSNVPTPTLCLTQTLLSCSSSDLIYHLFQP